MKVVVYSTSSSDGSFSWLSEYKSKPSITEQWARIRKRYPEYEFVVVCAKHSAMHLLDFDSDQKEIVPEGIKVELLPLDSDADAYTKAIAAYSPDIAVAASYVGASMDWDTIEDAVISEKLEAQGIKTVAHSLFAASTFFDKWVTHQELSKKGFKVAKAFHIPSVYLTLKKDHPDVFSNVYIDLSLHKINQMNFPIIIKVSAGSGSNGITIANSYEEAKEAILSNEDHVDIIVEEMIQGEQFGTEIHGTPGNYTILPPFKFTLNENGITDPMHNVKYGPVTDEKYKIKELREMLHRLAEEMKLAVTAQVDLAFDGNDWYIIEVNPRTSGMSITAAATEDRTPLEVILEACLEKSINYDMPDILEKCVNFRVFAEDPKDAEAFSDDPAVAYMETSSFPPEYGFNGVIANVVLHGFAEFSDIPGVMEELHNKYPKVITDGLVQAVKNLM